MSEKKDFDKNENIQEKLDYLGLDLDKIPKQLLKYEPLNFRISKFYDENHYRQYRYIPIKDITIGLNDKGKTNFYEKSNKDGIFTFKYHLIIEDESNDFE